MDELALLRDQVATERRHFAAVKEACRAALRAGGDREALADTCRAAIAYLAYGARRMHAQDPRSVSRERERGLAGRADAQLIDGADPFKEPAKGEPLKQGRVRLDRKSTRLNSSHLKLSRMPSSA